MKVILKHHTISEPKRFTRYEDIIMKSNTQTIKNIWLIIIPYAP